MYVIYGLLFDAQRTGILYNNHHDDTVKFFLIFFGNWNKSNYLSFELKTVVVISGIQAALIKQVF